MEEKLKKIIDVDVFRRIVLEGKEGIFTDELYALGKQIWKEAQKDLIEKIEVFEKENKILIITEDDRKLLHSLDKINPKHKIARERFKGFLKEKK